MSLELREYQKIDKQRILTQKRVLIANEQRTGKTPTVLSALQDMDLKGICFIICPAVLVGNFCKEIERWTTKTYTRYTSKMKGKCKFDTDIVIISVDTFKLAWFQTEFAQQKLKVDCVIIDECHFLIKNGAMTSRQKHCYNFIKKHNPQYILLMSGTPIKAHKSDVYFIYKCLLANVGSEWAWKDLIWNSSSVFTKEWTTFRPNMETKWTQLFERVAIRRTRQDVMQWLPPKNVQIVDIELTSEQKKMYTQMEKDLCIADIAETQVFDVLPKLLRLKQIALDPSLIEGVTCKETPAKIAWLLEFVSNFKTIDNVQKPVVIFSQFVSSVFTWVSLLESVVGVGRVATINGQTKQRDDVVQRFQEGKIDVLICQTVAASAGLTLDRADTVIFLDEMYEQHINIQAQDRVCPTVNRGDMRHDVILLRTNTIDERIADICNKKSKEML